MIQTPRRGVTTRARALSRSVKAGLLATALGALTSSAMAGEINYPSYHWNEPTYGSFLKELSEAYTAEHPDVTVKPTFMPFASYNDQMYIDITSGMPPDVLTALDPEFRRYVDADLLEPLDDYLAAAGISVDDFIAPEQLAMKDGHVYGIVFVANPRALFINKKMLDDAGLPLPTDLDSFDNVLTSLRDPATQTFGMALTAHSGAPSQQFLEYAPIFAAFGAKFFTAGKPTADSPEMIKALTWYKKVVDEGLVPKGSSFDVYRPMFVNGKVAMYAAGPFMGGLTAAGNEETYKNLVTMALPLSDEGKPITVTNYLSIPKGAKNKEDAAALLMEMLKPQWQERMVELIKAIPGRKGMVPDSFVAENPWFQTFADVASSAVSYAPEGAEQYGSEIINVIGPHMEAMLFAGVSPEETAKLMQEDLTDLMAEK